MYRKTVPKRENFAKYHEEIAFNYHNVICADGEPYWSEGVAYEFTLREIETVEAVTGELHSMCMETVGKIVGSGDYPEAYLLSDESKALIESSWQKDEMHIYGRFDLQYAGGDSVKMYEYNADTPTALLEAAVAQWQWLEDTGKPDQFNSIHDKLIARWQEAKGSEVDPTLHLFASKEAQFEDWGNLEYMADTAVQAGWNVNIDEIETLGYDSASGDFVDRTENNITHAFKLYPWEWMMTESFAPHVRTAPTKWFEPAWKMLLSNKAILPVLWQRYPNHPNLLPAYFKEFYGYLRKPVLGREGANIHLSNQLIDGSHFVEEYDTGYIYQEYAPLPEFDGKYPVIGSWVIGDEAAGMGIREDNTLISGNGSHFVPHYFID
ncbi:glutathionylspermidine synthase family protein [soil metagenome]